LGNSIGSGIFTVLASDILQGSLFLALKFTRRWEWENSRISFSTVAYLIAPWLLALTLIPHFPGLLHLVSSETIVVTLLCGVGWGVGALAMGSAYKYVGMAIPYAIVLGIASSIGTLVLLRVLTPSQAFVSRGLKVIVAVIISVIGTAVVGWAAWQRDSAKNQPSAETTPAESAAGKNVVLGLVLCFAASVMASIGNLDFAFGAELSRNAAELGAGQTGSSRAIWSIMCFPVFLVNFLYCLHLMNKNKTAQRFRESGTGYYSGLTAAMAVIWLAGKAAYGAGALTMGNLGASIGWVIFMTAIILFGNLLGGCSLVNGRARTSEPS
jgi:L-rhamnose-H+ transport protein